MVEDSPPQDEKLVEGEGFESTVIRSRRRPQKRSFRMMNNKLARGIVRLCFIWEPIFLLLSGGRAGG